MKDHKSQTEEGQVHEPPDEEVSLSKGMVVACERLSSERYRAFVDNMEEGVYEVDIHGNFLYFNDSLCRIFGYPRQEVQFQNFSRFIDERYVKEALEVFGRLSKTSEPVSGLFWKGRAKNGEIRVMEVSANLIVNKEGEKIGFRGIVRDITERYEAQEAVRSSERRYRALLDFVPYPIVAFTLEGLVSYLNPAFTQTFGWSLKELKGRAIPYVPSHLREETRESIKRLFKEKLIWNLETQRLTKDGRIMDVISGATLYSETGDEPSGELVILRDITQEKRMTRINEALLRISLALPEYPDLAGLLDYITGEVKSLLGVEGALVIFLDEEKKELYFKAASHDDSDTEKRVKEIRFPADKGVSGKVIETGKPMIVPDTSSNPYFYSVVDAQARFVTKSLLDVPLKSRDRIFGVLCAMNKKAGTFDKTDVELLNMLAGTVGLSIENARFSEELKEAYREVTSLNRAKDKVLNHLSHELKTPLSVLSASLSILSKKLKDLQDETWKTTIERSRRNLNRILEIQYQVEDIMRDRTYQTYRMLSLLLDECSDELVSLVSDEVGEGDISKRIRTRIDELFGPKESLPEDIHLDKFAGDVMKEVAPLFRHRGVEIASFFEDVPVITMPPDALRKMVEGLLRNAVENTPDQGRIEIYVRTRGKGSEFVVKDYGVGITEDNQRRIFEGFFTTQETMDYSSKRPFDFNAGGKGADLLRVKIFSERYGFEVGMDSNRCRYIPSDKDKCPGLISECGFCDKVDDCLLSGGTTFSLFFPGSSE